MDAQSQVDPWHLLAPTRIVQGCFGVFDFDLGYGKVVHDYLAEGAATGVTNGQAARAASSAPQRDGDLAARRRDRAAGAVAQHVARASRGPATPVIG